MSGLKIVSVVNNFDIYNSCIGENPFLSEFEKIVFDNSVENIGIPERYNSFIDTVKADDDFWVAFLHQDFMFNENPLPKLENLDKMAIYGAIGVGRKLFYFTKKPKILLKINKRFVWGAIQQGKNEDIIGIKINSPMTVKTLDCCICLAHSSLFAKIILDLIKI